MTAHRGLNVNDSVPASNTNDSYDSDDSDDSDDTVTGCVVVEEAELASLSSAAILRRTLNVNTLITTNSSSEGDSWISVQPPNDWKIVKIRAGVQGAIFEHWIRHIFAVTMEQLGDTIPPTTLRYEHVVHKAVDSAFRWWEDNFVGRDVRVHVPRVRAVLLAPYEKKLAEAPAGYLASGDGLLTTRILPMPKVVRKALISHFYPGHGPEGNRPLDPATVSTVLNDTSNEHCLVRTYLGREQGPAPTKQNFSLRDFSLYLKPMEELGMDVMGLARTMGKAFATIHWGTGVKGDGVKFVLGSSRFIPPDNDRDNQIVGRQGRLIEFWLLDFGQCDMVDLKEGAVDDVYLSFKEAMASGDNQLFIPHPRRTPHLYEAFFQGYVKAGQTILKYRGLDDRFDAQDFIYEYEDYRCTVDLRV